MSNTSLAETISPQRVAGIEFVADADRLRWFEGGRPTDSASALARVFGQFTLIGSLPALAAPGSEVLLYRPPNRRLRARLDVFPAHIWLEAEPGLWMAHDGEHLLLAPCDPLVARNMRGKDGQMH